MKSPPQRANIVLEHVSAVSDFDEEAYEDSWFLVAYLVLDSGKRKRVTLRRYDTRAEASAALTSIWGEVTAKTAQLSAAA